MQKIKDLIKKEIQSVVNIKTLKLTSISLTENELRQSDTGFGRWNAYIVKANASFEIQEDCFLKQDQNKSQAYCQPASEKQEYLASTLELIEQTKNDTSGCPDNSIRACHGVPMTTEKKAKLKAEAQKEFDQEIKKLALKKKGEFVTFENFSLGFECSDNQCDDDKKWINFKRK